MKRVVCGKFSINIALVLLLVGTVIVAPVSAATIGELQTQLKAAQDELARYQTLQKNERDKAQSYTDQIQKTQKQIEDVQNTIRNLSNNITQKEQDIVTTNGQIEAKTAQLNELNNKLNESIVSYYEMTNLTDVESLANQDNLSAQVDKSEYIQSLQRQILDTIDQKTKEEQDLRAAKTKLENQKQELAVLKGQQEAKNAKLNTDKQQKSNLLSKAKQNEAEYQALVKKLEKQSDSISQEIYALRLKAKKAGKEVYVVSTSAYPFSAINAVDPWLFYTRQCTSYAAWRWYAYHGLSFENTRPGQGSAYNWGALAEDQGYQVISTPKTGAIVSWPAGSLTSPYGHVAFVEAVNSDGTIKISEYNWNKYAFSIRDNVRYQDYGTAKFIIP